MTTAEIRSVDLFSDETLADPYPAYAALRAAGGAVYLERLDLFALPRHREVREALRDWETFSSAEGTAMDAEVNRRRAGNIISTDPPEHDVLRAVLADTLGPRAIRTLGNSITRLAEQLVERCVEAGSFDAMAEIARVLPVTVVCDLVGFPSGGRDGLLECANASFNTFGPMNERSVASIPKLEAIWAYLATAGRRDALSPGGVGEAIYAAADAGRVRPDQVAPLLFAFASAGMDTTVNAIGNAIWLLASHPEQWAALRAAPERVPAAFNEALRLESPIQYFTRLCRREVAIDNVRVPPGARVITLFGSANRDEAKWEHPERFEIGRNPTDHVAFGHGVHGCLGQVLARMEGHAVLGALAERAVELGLAEPTRKLHNILRGFARLPITVAT